MNLRDYLKSQGYAPVDESYYKHIRTWRNWYRGHEPQFHEYKIFNSGKFVDRTRASLKMAKQGCETWTNLLWNYECGVSIEKDETANGFINDVLRANDFWTQTIQLTEKAFALGSGAYITYQDGDAIRVDYVTAEYIYPLSWRGGNIESCAFAADYTDGSRQLVYLMIHEQQESGKYKISNRFFERLPDTGDIKPTEAPAGITESYEVGYKRFAILKPNIANNLADVPLGLSIYGNYIDTLKNIDLAFDGAKVCMEIGRPRMGVTSNMMKVDIKDGKVYERFDPNDIAVYDLGMDGSDPKVDTKDLSVPYRAADFENSLQTQLNIYSQNLGLGDKAFKWDRGQVLTAKQVISDDAAMLRTMEKHQEGLRSTITDLVRAILDTAGMGTEEEIAVVFDDSVTRDKEGERERAWQWVVFGRMAFWRYLNLYEGFEEEAAKDYEAEAYEAMKQVL